jgi:predicted transcriptional regulator
MGKRPFLLFIVTLIFIITISTVLPCFQEIEASDSEGEDNYFDSQDSRKNDIIAPSPFLIPLYFKTPQNLFLNETRANIFDVISNNPGVTFGAITRELNLAFGECQYHIRVLEREGYIKSKRTGKYTRYYLIGQKVSGFSKIQEEILFKIKEKEGLSQSEIAAELGISRQVVNYNIRFLVRDNKVLEVRENSKCSYFIL